MSTYLVRLAAESTAFVLLEVGVEVVVVAVMSLVVSMIPVLLAEAIFSFVVLVLETLMRRDNKIVVHPR